MQPISSNTPSLLSAPPAEEKQEETVSTAAKPRRRRRKKKKPEGIAAESPHEHLKYRYNDRLSTPLKLSEAEHALLKRQFEKTAINPGISINKFLFLRMYEIERDISSQPLPISNPTEKSAFQAALNKLHSDQSNLLVHSIPYSIRQSAHKGKPFDHPACQIDKFFPKKKLIFLLLAEHSSTLKDLKNVLMQAKNSPPSTKRERLRQKKIAPLLASIEEYREIFLLLQKFFLHPDIFLLFDLVEAADFPGAAQLTKGNDRQKVQGFHSHLNFFSAFYQYVNEKKYASIQIPVGPLKNMSLIAEKFFEEPIDRKAFVAFESELEELRDWLKTAKELHEAWMCNIIEGKTDHASFFGRKKTQTLSQLEFLSQAISSNASLSFFEDFFRILILSYQSQIIDVFQKDRLSLEPASVLALEFLGDYFTIEQAIPAHPLTKEIEPSLFELYQMISTEKLKGYTFSYYVNYGYIPWKKELNDWKPFQVKAEAFVKQLIDAAKNLPSSCTEIFSGMDRNKVKEELVKLDAHFQGLVKKSVPVIALANALDQVVIDRLVDESPEEGNLYERMKKEMLMTFVPKKLTVAIEELHLLHLLDEIAPLQSKPKAPKEKKPSKKEKTAQKKAARRAKISDELLARGHSGEFLEEEKEFDWRRGTKVGIIIEDLCSRGFSKLPAAGDHWKLKHEDGRRVIVPFTSKSDTLKRGTLNSIKEMANSRS